MTDELIFYTNPMSRGRIVRWMLEETGLPYRTEIVQYGPEMKAPAYRAINPMGKVPAVKRGGVVVTECAAICAWLAEIAPDAGLAPRPEARGAYYRWLFFTAGPVEASATNRALGVTVPDDKRGMVGYGCAVDVIETLETALTSVLDAGTYIAGPAFSAADVYLGSHVGWGMEFGTIERRPAFEKYFARLENRPARLRAIELDNAAMPPKDTA